MPDTLPGLLITAGIVIFVLSHFVGEISVKEFRFPGLGSKSRKSLRWFAGLLMAIGSVIYLLIFSDVIDKTDTVVETYQPAEDIEYPLRDDTTAQGLTRGHVDDDDDDVDAADFFDTDDAEALDEPEKADDSE